MNSPRQYPNVIGGRKLVWVAKVLENPFYSAGASVTSGFLPWLSILLGWIDKASYKYALGATGLIIVLGGLLLPHIIRISRYNILCKEIRKSINKLPIDHDTLFIGAGGGSFKAIGMLLKAWEEEKAPDGIPPDSLCVSMACKKENERDFYPSLNEIKSCVNNSNILIVLAQIGTGSTAQSLLTWAKSLEPVKEINLFSLIISETAADSGDWAGVFTLGIINRRDLKHSVLPWVSTRDEY